MAARSDEAGTLGRTVSDLVPLEWWEHLERSGDVLTHEATLRLAACLVQDGVTGVTLVLPRAAGLLVHARLVAQAAGIELRATQIDSATITLRFSGQASVAQHRRADGAQAVRGRPLQERAKQRTWLPTWLRARVLGCLLGLS